MQTIHISKDRAKDLIFNSQYTRVRDSSALQIIQHLGYVQIDTIAVVERAHHHTFWTRNHQYSTTDLASLIKQRRVFEYWSHAASYLPIEDYRFTLPLKKSFLSGEKSWYKKDPSVMNEVLERIRKEGPLKSKDFKQSKSSSTGWWDWKPSKRALEQLFLEGRLEISGRDGFQKVYDLPERVIPQHVNTTMPTQDEYIQYLIERTLRHHGIASTDEIAYLQKRDVKNKVNRVLNNMIEDKSISLAKIEGIETDYYAFSSTLDLQLQNSSQINIFSPFDNLTIQRKKLSGIFNFDYQIECYVPQVKRKFGYFCLPLFYGSTAIGRIDCKAFRKEKKLCIHSLHFEETIKSQIDEIKPKLVTELQSFAMFNGCTIDESVFN